MSDPRDDETLRAWTAAVDARIYDDRRPRYVSPAEPTAPIDPIDPLDEAVLVSLADVQPTAIDWLWPSRLAAGKITLLVGDPGLGKSWLSLDLAARLSRGAAWPDGGVAPRASTVLLSAEDALDDTIRPRLDALGADVTQIHALTAIRAADGERTPVLTRDLARLERAVTATRAKLVTIDPLSAYLGDADSHRDAEVRAVLAPLAALADRTGAAVLAVMHLSKGTQRPALYRAVGSIGFVASARLVLAVAAHPDDDTRRLLAPVKSNLCAPAATLAYRLADDRMVWEDGPVAGIDVETLLGGVGSHEDREAQTDAEQVITGLLDDGSEWPLDAKQALDAGRAHGINDRTLQRTAKRLGIRISRVGFGARGRWVWHRPAIDDTSIDDTPPRSVLKNPA
jgi:hypothetical protein